MNQKVSIVIPCYNSGETLPETLSSIENVRNDRLLEVIIVDDGSTDKYTLEVMGGLDAAYYTILHQRNSGLGAARNVGIRVAKGEFIIPLDSDNRLRASYLTQGVETLIKNPVIGVVYGNAKYFGKKEEPWIVPTFDLPLLTTINYIDACAIFRKKVWEMVGGYDENMPHMGWEDWDFWLRAASKGWEFYHLEEIAFDYRVQGVSMLSETDRHHRELIAYMFRKPENRLVAVIRRQQQKIEKFAKQHTSVGERLGRQLVRPLRSLKPLWRSVSKIANDNHPVLERIQDIEI